MLDLILIWYLSNQIWFQQIQHGFHSQVEPFFQSENVMKLLFYSNNNEHLYQINTYTKISFDFFCPIFLVLVRSSK